MIGALVGGAVLEGAGAGAVFFLGAGLLLIAPTFNRLIPATTRARSASRSGTT